MRVQKNRVLGLLGIAAAAGIGLLIAQPAHATAVTWADWTGATPGVPGGSASATIATSPTPVSVSYSGEVESLVLDYPSWGPSSSYVGGTVSNAPPQSGNIVQLFGGITSIDTINFSTPVVDPVMAIWSLGASGTLAQFDFTSAEPFTIEAGGPSNEYGGASIFTTSSTPFTIYGAEGNGTLQFNGTFSSISWDNPAFENWYGFTVGIEGVASTSGVPLPGSLPMAGVGMFGILAWAGVKSFRQARKMV
jgi:hypothetical protein